MKTCNILIIMKIVKFKVSNQRGKNYNTLTNEVRLTNYNFQRGYELVLSKFYAINELWYFLLISDVYYFHCASFCIKYRQINIGVHLKSSFTLKNITYIE